MLNTASSHSQVNLILDKLQFDAFIAEKRFSRSSPKTIENHKLTLVMFVKYLINRSKTVDDIQPKIIMEYFTEMENSRGWNRYTTWTNFKNLRAYFNWCVKQNIKEENPFLKIPPPRQPHQLPKALTENELTNLLNSIQRMEYKFHFTKIRDIAIVYMIVFTGLRRSELLNLTMEDVSLESGMIRVEHGKGDKRREIPIHVDVLKPILIEYLENRNRLDKKSKWFFNGTFANRGKNDNKLTIAAINNLFQNLSRTTGIKVTPHRLRHSFATFYINKIDNIYYLKDLMGHTDISTTTIYLSISTKKKIDSINKLHLEGLQIGTNYRA